MKVYLHEELQKLLPEEIHTEEFLHNTAWRLENVYFHEKFGTLPTVERISFPDSLGSVINPAFEGFLKQYALTPLGFDHLPSRTGGYYSDGKWLSGDGTFMAEVSNDVGKVFYTIRGRNEEVSKSVLKKLRTKIFGTVRGKVLQFHDSTRIVPQKEIVTAPTWAELKGTIHPRVATRVDEVVLPFFQRVERFKEAGVPPRLGILMHGAPGTGKTFLLRTLIREMAAAKEATIAHVSADQFTGRISVRDLFAFLQKFAPLIMILEDIELVAMNRENVTGNPTVQALLDVMDGAVAPLDRVMLIATTNRPEQIDEAFKRPGRFDEVWAFEPPAENLARKAFAGYFDVAKLRVPVPLVDAVVEMNLTYAELKYVSVDLIRKAIVAGVDEVKASAEELREMCEDAKRGVEAKRMGFARPSGSRGPIEEYLERIGQGDYGYYGEGD